jgi:hypothetical protein
MITIKCTHCGKEIELREALAKDIEKLVREVVHVKYVAKQLIVNVAAQVIKSQVTVA